MKKLKRAVFLDRDGTINKERGYIKDPKKLVLLPRAAEAIRLLNRRSIPVIVVTNQSGIARKYYSENQMHLVNAALVKKLQAKDSYVDAIYFCPHHPDFGGKKYRRKCNCRKPAPGMVLKAARKFGIDPRRSYMAGDKIADVKLGQGVGAKSILLLSGWGRKEWRENRNLFQPLPDYRTTTLWRAVQWILKDMERGKK